MRNHTQGMRRRAALRTGARGMLEWLAVGVLVLLVAGCSIDGLLETEDLPDNVSDPSIIETPKGAMRAYHGALSQFRAAFTDRWASVVGMSANLTDELTVFEGNPIDSRNLPEGEDEGSVADLYGNLNKVRGQAMQAIGLQRDYAPDSLAALTGHLYALQAYAEIFLADLFCSGIPLSTLDYRGDFTYRPGSTTEQVYEHALVLLDTALTHVGDSVRFANLAKVGRGRALLNLGRFGEAAAAVADVPDDFSYGIVGSADSNENLFTLNIIGAWPYTVGDREGANGLDFRTAGDPRVQIATYPGTSNGTTAYYPAKYSTDGSTPVVLASGIEARLIEAEAALNAADPAWLDKLNHLRRTMWTTIRPAVGGPLPDLTDPGNDAARIDLLYRERAFWLFMTGQRQGDLRRLMRLYDRKQEQVYPTGPYIGGKILWYGLNADFPVPAEEKIYNRHYKGCFSRS